MNAQTILDVAKKLADWGLCDAGLLIDKDFSFGVNSRGTVSKVNQCEKLGLPCR